MSSDSSDLETDQSNFQKSLPVTKYWNHSIDHCRYRKNSLLVADIVHNLPHFHQLCSSNRPVMVLLAGNSIELLVYVRLNTPLGCKSESNQKRRKTLSNKTHSIFHTSANSAIPKRITSKGKIALNALPPTENIVTLEIQNLLTRLNV